MVEIAHDGEVVAIWDQHNGWSTTAYHSLLRALVVGCSVPNPEVFVIVFEGNLSLRIYDKSKQFESFSIQPGNIFI